MPPKVKPKKATSKKLVVDKITGKKQVVYLRARVNHACPKCQGDLEVTMHKGNNKTKMAFDCWVDCLNCRIYTSVTEKEAFKLIGVSLI